MLIGGERVSAVFILLAKHVCLNVGHGRDLGYGCVGGFRRPKDVQSDPVVIPDVRVHVNIMKTLPLSVHTCAYIHIYTNGSADVLGLFPFTSGA